MHRKILISILALTSVTTSALETKSFLVPIEREEKGEDKVAFNGHEVFEEWPNEELI